MKITNIILSTTSRKARLSAQLVLESGKTHDVFFEIDRHLESYILGNSTPFMPLALPIAMLKNENLTTDSRISSLVQSNLYKIMKILTSWNEGFNVAKISAPTFKNKLKAPKRVGCFFSGGADSFYTYLKNRNKINYLIFVHGFDIPLKDQILYKKVEKNIIKIAKTEKVKLIKVRTNLRQTLDLYFDWDMAHAFALASVSLFLSRGFKEIYMSCGMTGIGESHHFMTPELDKLWSTENMDIDHFGCEADKISKLQFLSHYNLVKDTLRVCWVNKHGQYNCCECEKCMRNMLVLYASDSLEKFRTFEKPLNIRKLKKVRVSRYSLKYFISVLRVLREKKDNSETRYALEKFVKNYEHPTLVNRFVQDTRALVGEMDKKYNHNRLYWFLARRAFI